MIDIKGKIIGGAADPENAPRGSAKQDGFYAVILGKRPKLPANDALASRPATFPVVAVRNH